MLGIPIPYWDWTVDEAIPDFWPTGPLHSGIEGGSRCGGLPTTTRGTNINITSDILTDDVEAALNETNFRDFSRLLYNPHGKIHDIIGCDMGNISTAAYDPIFYLHHSFAEKVLVDWQKLHPRTPRILSRRRIQRPFDDTRYNRFMEITGITDRQSWDYERNLCYCYDCDLPTVTSTL